ncbi:LUD domain-containing protein [Kocuria palustris]|uniref:LutC/YkgG family protein n=1 Tax=Kocuria palustris TaxID=71999 RepID=UPI0011A35504|nr:LUD domain-containing protein [Kocuria palustris]
MSTDPRAEAADARSTILTRIRASIADQPQAPQIPRGYRRRSELSPEQIVDMLENRLVDYRATVHREDMSSLRDRLAELLAEGPTIVPEGLDAGWLPESLHTVRDSSDTGQPLSPRELDEVAAVVTTSTVSCAETGTIFLNSAPGEGRRALSLVPDHHVCIVPLDSVVELIPEAFERIDPEAPVTMISGPSATSDIELERVEGVHGPRRLDVILLDRG